MTLQLWLILGGLLAGQIALGRPRRLRAAPALKRLAELAPDGSGVRPFRRRATVIVPARNEAASLPRLLRDLAAQHGVALRVIVVDDHSDDGTADIARSFPRVEVIEAPELPPGWCGKPWACHVGAGAATDDVLVFLDADVRLAPLAMASLLEELATHGGMVSVQPHHQVGRPVEHLSATFNVLAVMGAGAGVSRPTGAFGPVLATSRQDYLAAGGHAGVRHEVVEDMALARAFRRRHLPLTLRLGGALIGFRMYPLGGRQMIEGWTKNFATGAGNTPPLRLVAAVAWVYALISASTAAVGALLGAGGISPVGAAVLVLAAAQFAAVASLVGNFSPLTAAALPLHVGFFVMIFLRSLERTLLRRSVSWRGREIDLRNRPVEVAA